MKKTFDDQLTDLQTKAEKQIKSWFENNTIKKLVDTDESLEDYADVPDTVSIAFYGKHGFMDFGHVWEIYKEAEGITIRGLSYNGIVQTMDLSDADSEGVIRLADYFKPENKRPAK